ncbi:MAG: M23 family metallopeptidase [Spirochaetales bacterium]|nr:M23 family metallopeptidase [Spirochaetales bacterium]
MKYRMIVYLVLFSLLLTAFEWPVSKVLITATFGESRGDHFHAGIDLAGEDQEIKPVSAGDVVFRYEEGVSFSSIPIGLGSFLVLEDDTGIRSLYAHIKQGTIPLSQKRFEKQDTIGIIGNTGYSFGKHLHLTIIDHKEKIILNPLIVFKNEAKFIKDRTPPVIEALYYKSKEGELKELLDHAVLNLELIELFVRGHDIHDGVKAAVAPYEIKVVHNDMRIIQIIFNALQFKDGVYCLNSCGKKFSDLYVTNKSFADVMFLGKVELVKGKNQIDITLIDFYGNTTAREVNIWVGSPP